MNIHKPTHKIFDENGTPAIGLLQVRGRSLAYLNRLENGKVVESTKLLSIGKEEILRGTPESLQYIWGFYFGDVGQKPMKIETVD